jgi:4-hydroxybenzoate polyprenyltransferase
MIRLCLIEPVLRQNGFELQMKAWEFAILVIATIFISAAGYIINDYFDVRIDNINNPGENVIDKDIGRRYAILAHGILSSLGVAIGIFLAWKSHILLTGGVLFTVSVIALWFYSTTYKYKFLSGNLIISLLTSMVPFMVALFEVPRIIPAYYTELIRMQSTGATVPTHIILLWTGCYGIAAFFLTLIREIIKDMEDMPGDREYGCRTIPIVLGVKKAKWIVAVLIITFIAGIGYIQKKQLDAHDKTSFLYFLLLVQVPLMIILFRVILAAQKKHFYQASILIKFVMLTGICFLFLVRFLFLK